MYKRGIPFAVLSVNIIFQIQAAGLPPAHYGLLYRKFERYFNYRRIPYTIAVGEVISYPQDYAAAMTIYPEVKRHTKARIIDIGGFSVITWS